MKKRVFSLLLAVVILICSAMPIVANAQSYEQQLLSKGFPKSYVSALVELHKKYPKWTFNAFDTKLDWEYSVNRERDYHSHQLIQKISGRSTYYYCSCQNCYANGSYVVREAGNWVSASQAAVKYYMDPRNWLDEKHIFQFETISYDKYQTQDGVESILANSWMSNKDITYLTTGLNKKTYTSNGKNVKYSGAIMDAAKYSGMSAYYLASRLMQEVGGSSSSAGVTGNVVPFTGIYNFYSIGANSGGNDGLQWASGFMLAKNDTYLYPTYTTSTGKASGDKIKVSKGQNMTWMADTKKSDGSAGAYYKVRLYNELGANSYSKNGTIGYIPVSDCRTTYFNYGRPWTNPYKAIYYGADYISNNFSEYQFTGYLQKFNVNGDYSAPFTHEYMANVSAPSAESEISYKAYSKNGLLDSEKVFYIPVFKNMPDSASPEPSASATVTAPTVPAKKAPSKVTGVSVSNVGIDNISIKWNSTSNADGYYVYRYYPDTKKSTKLATVNGATSYKHNGLKSNKRYDYYVLAYNSAGKSDKSATVNATTVKIDKPAKVGGLKMESNGSSSVKIKWQKSARAWGYYVYRYSSKTGEYTKIATIKSGSTTSYKQTGLNAGSGYDYCVIAYNPAGKAKKSKVLHTCTRPSKVGSVKLKASATDNAIKVKWKKINACSGYQLQYSREKSFSSVIATRDVDSNSTLSYTGRNFTKGDTYYARVRAYKIANGIKYYGNWSSVKSIVAK